MSLVKNKKGKKTLIKQHLCHDMQGKGMIFLLGNHVMLQKHSDNNPIHDTLVIQNEWLRPCYHQNVSRFLWFMHLLRKVCVNKQWTDTLWKVYNF